MAASPHSFLIPLFSLLPSFGRRCPEGAEVGSRSNIFTRGNANPASLHSSAPSRGRGRRVILDRASPFIKIYAERCSGTLINDVLETLFPALFHAACTLSAPSGHLPLKGKADDTRIPSSNMQRSRHESPEPKSLSMTKKPGHASSVFWLFYWRRSRTVIFHFTQRRSTPESLAMSRGLAMCSFMPAFWARTTSSTKAFAVIARIGSALASLLGRRRIALVAS